MSFIAEQLRRWLIYWLTIFLGLRLLRGEIIWNVPLREFGSCAIDKPTGGNLYRRNVARAIAWHVLALARLHYSIRWFRTILFAAPMIVVGPLQGRQVSECPMFFLIYPNYI